MVDHSDEAEHASVANTFYKIYVRPLFWTSLGLIMALSAFEIASAPDGQAQIATLFPPSLSHDAITTASVSSSVSASRFDAAAVRELELLRTEVARLSRENNSFKADYDGSALETTKALEARVASLESNLELVVAQVQGHNDFVKTATLRDDVSTVQLQVPALLQAVSGLDSVPSVAQSLTYNPALKHDERLDEKNVANDHSQDISPDSTSAEIPDTVPDPTSSPAQTAALEGEQHEDRASKLKDVAKMAVELLTGQSDKNSVSSQSDGFGTPVPPDLAMIKTQSPEEKLAVVVDDALVTAALAPTANTLQSSGTPLPENPASASLKSAQFGVNLGAQQDVGRVETFWKGLVKLHETSLKDYRPLVFFKSLKGADDRAEYIPELVVGPLSSIEDARALCEQLEIPSDCRIVGYEGQRLF